MANLELDMLQKFGGSSYNFDVTLGMFFSGSFLKCTILATVLAANIFKIFTVGATQILRTRPHKFTRMVPAGVGEFCWPQLLEPRAKSQLLQHLHVTQIKALREVKECRVSPVMAGLSQQG